MLACWSRSSAQWWSSSTSMAKSSHCAAVTDLRVSDGRRSPVPDRPRRSPSSTCSMPGVTLGEAVEAGRCASKGHSMSQRAHDSLRALHVHAAVRAPSQPALLSELRAGPPLTECICTPASSERRPTAAVLGPDRRPHRRATNWPSTRFRRPRSTSLEPTSATDWEPSRRETSPACQARRGLHAASRYLTVGPDDGSNAELRPFPADGASHVRRASGAGEHRFRFFPRTTYISGTCSSASPSIASREAVSGKACWALTPRTVYDDVGG